MRSLLLCIAAPLWATTIEITQGTMICQPPDCGGAGNDSRLVLSGLGDSHWMLSGSVFDGWYLGWGGGPYISFPSWIGPWESFTGSLTLGGVVQPGNVMRWNAIWKLSAATIHFAPGQSFYSEPFTLSAAGVQMTADADGSGRGPNSDPNFHPVSYGDPVDLSGSGTVSVSIRSDSDGIPTDVTFHFGGRSAGGPAVPEPATAWLALLGLVAFVSAREMPAVRATNYPVKGRIAGRPGASNAV